MKLSFPFWKSLKTKGPRKWRSPKAEAMIGLHSFGFPLVQVRTRQPLAPAAVMLVEQFGVRVWYLA